MSTVYGVNVIDKNLKITSLYHVRKVWLLQDLYSMSPKILLNESLGTIITDYDLWVEF